MADLRHRHLPDRGPRLQLLDRDPSVLAAAKAFEDAASLVPRGRVLYDTSVDHAAFEEAVLALAEDGERITKARVAERLSIDPKRAGEMLDRMTQDGALELDIDERSSEIFYTVSSRRAPAKKKGGGLSAIRDVEGALDRRSSESAARTSSDRAAIAAKVGTALVLGDGDDSPTRRKISLGVVLGGLFPGLGLAYAAPWPVVVGASIVVIAGAKIIALIPIVSSFLLVPFLVVCAIASGVLGGAYAWSYNQAGKRAPIGDEPVTPKALLSRVRKKG